MGDRFNPIKFGPEWLRKLSREPSNNAGNGSGREGADPTSLGGPPVTPGAPPPGMSLQPPHRPNNNPNASANSNTSKIHLAKLRYGREEMLALYDKNTVEAPSHLKTVEALYLQKPKPPYALNLFEDEMRDMRGLHTLGERYGVGRGRGLSADNRVRIPSVSEPRGRSRLYNRPTPSVARTVWHGMPSRNPHTPEEEASLKSWTNNASSSGIRPNAEQIDWANKPTYRTKRPTNTNWRQTSREEGEEWRSTEARRPEKWDREWPERSSQEKTWHMNRRTWVGGDAAADDALPEWAVENSEACAGTFDSSGAFHGYSHDDTNLPKSSAEPYVLARSQTHGNFTRSKTADEGSDEWWASEKAKKLSPKRFDASEIKFKKPPSSDEPEPKPQKSSGARMPYATSGAGTVDNETNNPPDSQNATQPSNKDVKEDIQEKLEPNKAYRFPFERKAETTDDKGNFQSVMMTGKNSLRQKHQNIGTPPDSPVKQPQRHFFMDTYPPRQPEANEEKDKDKIVDEMLQLNLDADNMPLNQLLGNRPNPGMSTPISAGTSAPISKRVSAPIPVGLSALIAAGMTPQVPKNKVSQKKPTVGPSTNQYASSPMPVQPAASKSVMNPLSNAMPPPSAQSQAPTSINLQNNGSLQPANVQNTQPVRMPGLASGLASGLQASGLPGPQSGPSTSAMPFQGAALPNMPNNSLYVQRPIAPMPNANEMANQVRPQNMPPHNISPPLYDNSFYSNMVHQLPPALPVPNLSELWYYEDPNHTIQGPFTTTEMLHWYRAGFFSPNLMVRRANEIHMSPLGNYGPHPFGTIVPNSMGMPTMPFVPQSHVAYNSNNPDQLNNQMAVATSMPPFSAGIVPVNQIQPRPLPPPIPMPFPHPIPEPIPVPDTIKTFGSLWSPPGDNLRDLLWAHNMQAFDNKLYYFDDEPPQLPMAMHEDITKDMKTEDEILAQMRANQPPRPASSISALFHDEEAAPPPVLDDFTGNSDLNMQDLQKLMQKDDGDVAAPPRPESEPKQDMSAKIEQNGADIPKTPQSKPADSKQAKVTKVEEKSTSKNKDQPTKSKPKKTKDDKRENSADGKPKETELKTEKRSNESSPSSKNKKDDKSKKELENEKKEWIKEGFTIVKSAEKKDKKKTDDTKAAEEAERKRKEEEKAEQELRKRQIETLKKQQEIQNQHQQQTRQAEQISRKAPWSAANQTIAPPYPGPTLAEIQRLEREKKLEQMKEQQQMMQIIAQQQQAALAREQVFGGQELQGGLGWVKKQANNTTTQNQSLAEIQAEARKQAAAANAAREEALPKPKSPTPVNIVPWGSTAHNGAGSAVGPGGFWDTPAEQTKPAKPAEPKPIEVKPKKKVVVVPPPKIQDNKKEVSPSADFDTWCTNALVSWSDSNIDVPTFISFLRDIESPYEVKDYVKCYLGDTKDSNDFARQFLERRSRLLRVGMVTPSDDLCSPAIAINPRTLSGSDYTDVKGKGKKTKKNKMLKVDARNILGFSVTASEDRINVGDIDTV